MTKDDIKDYFDVALSTSLVLFAFDFEKLQVLLRKNDDAPFKGAWTLPSRYIRPEEGFEQNVRMVLQESIFSDDAYLEQLNAFGKVYRNPLGRVVNVGYYGLIKLNEGDVEKMRENGMEWFPYEDIPDLGFDHNEIIDFAKQRLKRRVKRRPVGFNLLPKEFTLTQLQTLYEAALDKSFDKRNFRKKIFNSKLVIDLDKTIETSNGKVSKLYRFDEDKYEKMSHKGYDFLF